MAGQMTFTVATGRFAAAGSRQGPRHRENEDSLRIAEAPDAAIGATHGNLYVVCDGVGGHNRGEVASAIAVEELARAYFATASDDAAENLTAAVAAANVQVLRSAEADEANSGMATTVVAAAVIGGRIVVANVGDSRAYIVTGETLRQVSRDHSLVQDQVERGFITPEEARTSPQRNVITRALGLAETVETELRTQDEPAAPTRLVLCTDGVHGVVDDVELAQAVGRLAPVAAVRAILDLVDERNGHDDATLIVVDLMQEIAQSAATPSPEPIADTAEAATQPLSADGPPLESAPATPAAPDNKRAGFFGRLFRRRGGR
jgi:PPM family protein phosphatase